MDHFASFADADAARTTDQQVCGAYVDKSPRYFLMPATASDDEIRDAAFELKNGRPVSTYEQFLLETAKKLREDQPA